MIVGGFPYYFNLRRVIMIKIKLGELKSLVSGVNEIMGEKLPIKAAYAFTKFAKKLQKEVQTYEENRRKLIDTYGLRDENGKLVINNGIYEIADKENFNKEFVELSDIETEIDFDPISLGALGDISLSPLSIMALEKVIRE